MLAAVEDDLQVELVPLLLGKAFFQVALGLFDVLALGELPALGEAVDVSVDGKGGHAEGLGHDHGSRLVADAGQGLEVLKVVRHFTAVLLNQDF